VRDANNNISRVAGRMDGWMDGWMDDEERKVELY
jgi:hypothetical protein